MKSKPFSPSFKKKKIKEDQAVSLAELVTFGALWWLTWKLQQGFLDGNRVVSLLCLNDKKKLDMLRRFGEAGEEL